MERARRCSVNETAHRLTASPYRGLALSTLSALGSVWIGLTFAYVFPTLPPSTAIVSTATALYVAALALTRPPRARARRSRALSGLG